MLPVEEVQIESMRMNNLGHCKSIYTKKQLDEFATFQDSQGTRRTYLAETAELAHNVRNEKGEWGLALGAQAESSMIDITGMSFIPLYKVIGPVIFFALILLIKIN
jgi:hypothetical protein